MSHYDHSASLEASEVDTESMYDNGLLSNASESASFHPDIHGISGLTGIFGESFDYEPGSYERNISAEEEDLTPALQNAVSGSDALK